MKRFDSKKDSIYIYNIFEMLRHGRRVISNILDHMIKIEISSTKYLWLGRKFENFGIMANISKISYLILSYEIVKLAIAYSSSFSYAVDQ